jgi:hypothetical protein
MTPARAKKLALQEAYRLITVREGDEVLNLPAIQAVMRQQVRLAAKGNGPAQRAVIAMIQAIEQEAVEGAITTTEISPDPSITDEERAEAVLALLQRTKYAGAIARDGDGSPDRGGTS